MTNGQGVTPTWLRQVATALSSRYGVQVREGSNWSMDIEKHVLFYKAEHLLALDRDTCLGILLHELGHLHHSTNDWLETAKLMKLPTKDITFENVNAFEDVRINEIMSRSYGGSRELIDAMNELLAGDGLESLTRMSEEIKRKSRTRDFYPLPEYSEITYISMLYLMGIADDSFLARYYDQHKVNLVREIIDAMSDVRDEPTTKGVYDRVERDVWTRLLEYLPQPSPQSGDGDGSDSEHGEASEKSSDGGASSNRQDEQSEGENQGDSSSTTAKGSDVQEQEENAGVTESNSSSSSPDEPEPEPEPEPESKQSDTQESTSKAGDSKSKPDSKQPEPKQSADGVSIADWKKSLERKIQQAIKRGRVNPDEEHRTEPFTGKRALPVGSHIRDEYDVDIHLSDSKALQSQFANKFASIFRDNQYSRDVARQRHGRLDKRSLHKFPLGNSRLFKRKLDMQKKSYAVAFLQDVSGSMHWNELQGSYHAMLAFSTTLDKLKIPYGMGFFGSHGMIETNVSTQNMQGA
jgi:hypothetical protein